MKEFKFVLMCTCKHVVRIKVLQAYYKQSNYDDDRLMVLDVEARNHVLVALGLGFILALGLGFRI